MSEPNAGSDVVSMKLKAEKKGEALLTWELLERELKCTEGQPFSG